MALFHFHAAQVKRSAGQSAVACAAYRAASKGMTIDLKRVAHAVSYMQTNNIRTLDDLQERIRLAEKATTSVREKSDRMKEIKKIMDCLSSLRQLKPLADEYNAIRWKKSRRNSVRSTRQN
ncbi:MAG TPA: hypothetical protein PLN48_03975 [Lachnospiraceae bacterium]|nr:hypothetical protein [Lachnospiraceae bacterium]